MGQPFSQEGRTNRLHTLSKKFAYVAASLEQLHQDFRRVRSLELESLNSDEDTPLPQPNPNVSLQLKTSLQRALREEGKAETSADYMADVLWRHAYRMEGNVQPDMNAYNKVMANLCFFGTILPSSEQIRAEKIAKHKRGNAEGILKGRAARRKARRPV